MSLAENGDVNDRRDLPGSLWVVHLYRTYIVLVVKAGTNNRARPVDL
jgi:hypothetical protein